MDSKKVEVIRNWTRLKLMHNVQCFLGFANFYRIFIKGYSQIATSLMRLTYKEKLKWELDAENAFQNLKKAFITTLILIHPDFLKPFHMEIDVFDFALEAILSQQGEDKRLHLVAFHFKKFSAAKINYEIHDKELLAIINSFQEWCHLLKGTVHPVTIYTNYKNLEYFILAPILNRRQAR